MVDVAAGKLIGAAVELPGKAVRKAKELITDAPPVKKKRSTAARRLNKNKGSKGSKPKGKGKKPAKVRPVRVTSTHAVSRAVSKAGMELVKEEIGKLTAREVLAETTKKGTGAYLGEKAKPYVDQYLKAQETQKKEEKK